MATKREVGLKIEVDGEKEYKSAIADLNRGNQVLASELRKVQEQFKGNENSIEALNAKGDVLQRQLLQQQDKVQTLRAALQNAATQYGEADRRTQEWQIKLNNAETAQVKLERAISENNDAIQAQEGAMERAGDAVGGLGDQLDGLAGKLGVSIPDAAKGALNEIDGFSASAVASFGLLAGGAAAVINVAQELFDLTKQAAAEADALLTRSAQTGLSTDLLQQLDYAQKFLDFDGIDKSLQRLTQSMGNATVESSKQAAAFQELGVSIYDGNGKLRNNYEVFLDVIDALGAVGNETQRDIIANQLFGKSYAEMLPLIKSGSAELKKYTDQAKEMGYIVDEYGVKVLGRLDDAVQENQTAVTALKNQVAVDLAPLATDTVDLWTMVINGLRNTWEKADLGGAALNVARAYGTVYDAGNLIIGQVGELTAAQSENADSAEATAQRMADATGTMQESVQALAEKYREAQEKYKDMLDGQFGLFEDASERLVSDSDAAAAKLAEFWQRAYDSAEKSISGQFGLFDEASTEVTKNADDIIKALESQIAYWTQYEDNLDALLHSGIDGIQEFVAAHSDGSAKSVEAVAVLAAATDEEKVKILGAYDALITKQGEVAQNSANMATAGAESSEALAESTESYAQRQLAALDSQLQYWEEYRTDFDALKSRNIDGIAELASKFEDGSEESKRALAELRSASDDEIAAIIQKMREVDNERGGLSGTFAMLDEELAAEFAKIKDDWAAVVQEIAGTAGSVDFGPFNQAVEKSFSFLAETSKTGNVNMAAAFKSGSETSQESLEMLKTETGEKIEAIIGSLGRTEKAKDDLVQRFDDMTTSASDDLEQIEAAADSFVAEFNTTIASVDFSPFTDSVDSAFSFLENRAGDSVSTVRGWLGELSREIDAVEARAANVRVGHNAGGTDYWQGGPTYLAENGPELVELPRGSQVHTAQETRQILGQSTDTREMEAKLGQTVSLLGQIAAELAGLKVRGRMA